MMRNLEFKNENIGNSEYLYLDLSNGKDIINYQMNMLLNAKIYGLISVDKKQENENIRIYYDITSKKSLDEILSRRAMTKDEFIKLTAFILSVYDEIKEYQLISTGIILDSRYIYIKEDIFEPEFIYVPCYTKNCGMDNIKEFLLNLLLNNKVKSLNDNFVQQCIDKLNSTNVTRKNLLSVVGEEKKNKTKPPIMPPPVPKDDIDKEKKQTETDKIEPKKDRPPKMEKEAIEPPKKNKTKVYIIILAVVVVAVICIKMLNLDYKTEPAHTEQPSETIKPTVLQTIVPTLQSVKTPTTTPTMAPTATPASSAVPDGMYLFNSDRERISEKYLETKTRREVRMILNEIYARNGYIFTVDEYNSYFLGKSWYEPKYATEEETEKHFNEMEQQNKKIIASYEQSKGWR